MGDQGNESHLLVKLRNLVLRTILKAGHIDGRSEHKRPINCFSKERNDIAPTDNIYVLDKMVDGRCP